MKTKTSTQGPIMLKQGFGKGLTLMAIFSTVIALFISMNASAQTTLTASVSSTNVTSNVCNGTAAVSVSGGVSPYTYLWSTGNSAAAQIDSLCAGTYSVIVTDANGNSTTASFTITTQCSGTVAASFFSDSTVCFGSTEQFTDNSTTTSGSISSWVWYFGDNSPNSNSQSPSYLYANAGTYNVYLIVTNSLGCKDTITKVVQVIDSVADVSFNYTSGTYCQSGTLQTPTVAIQGGVFSSSPAGLSIDQATGAISLPNSALGAYTVTYTTSGGCANTSSITTTISNTTPDANFSYSGSPFCLNGNNASPIFGPGASAGLFTASPAGLVFININTGEIDVYSSAAGTYTVTNTIDASGSCLASTATTTVIINSADDASFTYTSATFCQSGANQTPVITGIPGGAFSSAPAGLSINSSTGTINIAASVLGTYIVSYTTNGSCQAVSSITVTITTAPSANFSYSNSTFMHNGNDPFPIFGVGANAGTFSAAPAGLVFINVNTGEIDLAASTPGTYTVTNTIPSSGTCLTSNDATTVTISGCVSYTSILDSMFQYPYNYCFNVYSSIYGRVSYTNLSANGTSSVIVNWGDGLTDTYPIAHNGSTDSVLYIQQPHVYAAPGVYTTTLKFYDANACYNDSIVGIINVSSASCGNLIGTVYEDANNNCTQDNGEQGIAGIEVQVTLGGVTYAAWTDYLGNYGFNSIPAGSYSIQINNINAGYTILCSNSLPHTGTITTGTSIENFAVSCNGSFDVAVTGISLMDGFYPGTYDAVLPHVGLLNNACNLTIAGQVKMILDPCIQYTTGGNYSWFSNPPSAVIHASSGDTLVWNVSDINNIGSFSYWDYAVNISTCTSAQVGDTACITMMVLPTAGDADLSNNSFTRCFAIGVSYDPNYKEVVPKGTGVQGFIPANTPELTYTINFQNTGTSAARNIYVIDSIDTDLNINSIEILSASHGVQVYELPNRAMKFMFANIMLPDSTHNRAHSHGYVTFRIKPNTGLAMGTQIKNRGHIYFDYNEPVATNTTLNTIAAPSGINEISKSGLLKVYPNPAKDRLVVSVSSNGSSAIVITDVLGKTVRQLKTNELQTEINVSDLQDGIYFIKLTQDNASYVEKIIISK